MNTKMDIEATDRESNCPSSKDRENRTMNKPNIKESTSAVSTRALVEVKGKTGVSASRPSGGAMFHAYRALRPQDNIMMAKTTEMLTFQKKYLENKLQLSFRIQRAARRNYASAETIKTLVEKNICNTVEMRKYIKSRKTMHVILLGQGYRSLR